MAEVEALIMKATQEVLSASPSLVPQRSTLVSSVLEALEGNASWVELYRHTGEVKVPDSNVELQTGELAEGIKALRQVSSTGLSPLTTITSTKIHIRLDLTGAQIFECLGR
jgi:hypothetical protein